VVVLNASSGEVMYTWGLEHEMIASGPDNTWGAHGLVVEECVAPCGGLPSSHDEPDVRVYIQDFY
jgi:hypothetical protein